MWAALGETKQAAAVDPESPPFPELLEYLWLDFKGHSAGLVGVSEGYPRVTWESLRAWSLQTNTVLEPWEAELLVTLGNIRANLHAEWRNQQIKAMSKK